MDIGAGTPLSDDSASTPVDAERQRRVERGRQRVNQERRRERGMEGSLGAVSRFLTAAKEHAEAGEADLAELRMVHDLLVEVRALEDFIAVRLLGEDYSYREVGIALDLKRAAVERRYPNASSRRAGGQPQGLL